MAAQEQNELQKKLDGLSEAFKNGKAAQVYEICGCYFREAIRDNEQALAMIEKSFGERSATPLRYADVFELLEHPEKEHAPFAPVLEGKERSMPSAALLTVFGNIKNALLRTSFRTRKGDVRFFSCQDYLRGEDVRWQKELKIRRDIVYHDAISGNLWCLKLLQRRFDRETAAQMVRDGGGLLRVGKAAAWGDIVLQARHALWRLGKLTAGEMALCSELPVMGYNNDELAGCDKEEWNAFVNALVREDKNALRSAMLKASRYQYALRLMTEGKRAEAEAVLKRLDGYWRSGELLQTDSTKRSSSGLVTLGGWKQGRDPELCAHFEPLHWRIVTREAGRCLLLCEETIDVQPMCDVATSGDDWQTCRLRRWLNGAFCAKAFTPEEQRMLLPAGAENDRVTLLTAAQAAELLKDQPEAWRSHPTPWAMTRGGEPEHWWYLPEGREKQVCTGKPGGVTRVAAESDQGVRPCVWVDPGMAGL